MREIQALDPTVDPDQAIRTPCAPAAPAVPKAPAAPATPAAAQALKLTDAAARLGEALCGVPTERNPSTPHTRGCTPGWYAVPRWDTPNTLPPPSLLCARRPGPAGAHRSPAHPTSCRYKVSTHTDLEPVPNH